MSGVPVQNSLIVRMTIALALVAAFVTTGRFVVPAEQAFASPAPAPTNFSTTTTGAYTGTVPDGVCAVTATVRGGAGGSTIATANANGGGAAVTATFAVVPGQTFSGTVGGGGAEVMTAGVNGGGAGGPDVGPRGGTLHPGAGGGGWSDLLIGGQSLIVSGGGGGSAGGHATDGGFGGNAGLPSAAGVVAGSKGVDGFQAGTPEPLGGQGGQIAAPGAGGVNGQDAARNGGPGSGRTGGNGALDPDPDAAGGGGGGYFGGGAGAASVGNDRGAPTAGGVSGGGGGGGSSFVATASPTALATAPTGISSAVGPRLADVGNGANGLVTLTWIPCQYDLAVAKSVTPNPVQSGNTVTWTVSITNLGPAPMTKGDTVTLTDTLPGAGTKTITSISVSGGTPSGLDSTTFSCSAGVGATMPATLTCSRPYAASGAPGAPSGGVRGLNAGETLTVTYTQPISEAAGAVLTNTATVDDRVTGDTNDTAVATLTVIAPVVPSTISGSVVDDSSPTPSGISGVTVTLYDSGGNVVATTTTDANGNYSFTGLMPGTYTVTETQPAGYGDGTDSAGTSGGSVSNDSISNVVLTSGTNVTGVVFAETTSSLSGVVYDDANGNGVLDPGEELSGVSVTLTGTDDAGNTISVPATTDSNGAYSFDGLLAGTYTVTESQPVGYTDGADYVGTSGGTLSAPDSITAIALVAGTDATGYDFTEYIPSSISGSVVDDSSPTPTGIPNVTITLYDSGGNVVATTTTDASGNYSFTGLMPGTYTVTESQPVGYGDGGESIGTSGGTLADDSISNIVLTSGTVVTGVNFDETTGSLAGTVYEDLNDNGVQDAGELGIPDVSVTLTGADDAGNTISVSATTDANGDYVFDGLLSGTYTIVETQPAGYADGTDAVGDTGGTLVAPDTIDAIGLAAGEDATGYDFGEYVTTSISGAVLDENAAGIGGVKIELYEGVVLVATTTTNPDGSYSFTDLAPGTYSLVELQPAGYGEGGQTATWPGADGTVANTISNIVLASGESSTDNVFTETYSSLSGVVYDDGNGNGTMDAGEELGDVELTLSGFDAAGNPVSATTTTNPDGSYTFDGLLAGTYTVTESQPAGYADGADYFGSEGGTVADPGDEISAITLPAGTDATGYDFTEYIPSSIAGRVVDDSSPTPSGISGVTVTLYDSGGNVVATTTTDASGNYSFTGLMPGTYTVVETQPAGYGDGGESIGTSGGTLADDSISNIVLTSGTDVTGVDFAETTGSLAGTVTDENGDPIEGVEITLTGTDALGNPVSRTTFTLSDGSYLFDNLVGGTYQVVETQPTDYGDGPDSFGTAGGTVDSATDTISGITLLADQDATGYDFTETLGSISGYAFIDADDDGFYTAGVDVPLAGVEVTLTGTDSSGAAITPVTLPTNTDGSYLFDDLLAGTYTVTEAQPLGYADGLDSVGSAGGTLANDEISAIPLAGGVDGTHYDFGELPPGAISGSVLDEHGDPIGGVEITLLGTDDNGDSVLLTTTTLADGSYTFSGLLPGTYDVIQTQPPGYADVSTSAGTLGGDDTVENTIAGIVIGVDPLADTISNNNNFVEGYSTLSGTVFDDANNNGVQDVGELGISGVSVTLTGIDDAGNTINVSVPTDDDGNYVFPDLLSGSYTLTEVTPSGYLDGIDTAGTGAGGVAVNPGDEINSIALPAGTDAADYDFAEIVPASVSGSVTDENVVPLEGVEITLTGTDDLGNPVTLTTFTAADGTYSFEGLRPGTYALLETQPAGYGDGTQSSDDAAAVTTTANVISSLVLESGETNANNDFVETLSSISGTVFIDLNNDGVQDAGEAGISGVQVTLSGTDAAGAPVNLVATTDANGDYVFEDILGGSYTLTEAQPAAYLDGIDAAGTGAGGVATNPGDAITGMTLAGGDDATGYDFGELPASSISGSVTDENVVPLEGVEITLTGTDDLGNPVTLTVFTLADGTYSFDGLRPGIYTITETQPAGYGDLSTSAGTSGGDDTTENVISAITLAANTDAAGYDFVESLGSIAGTVYDDLNNNGVQDAGELGIAGVEVTLTGTDVNGDPVSLLATTDGNGDYVFPDLVGGDYVLTEATPTGFLDGIDAAGTGAGGTAANPGDEIGTMVLPGGVDAAGYDFGELQPATISGTVEETDGTPIEGVTITLTGTDDLGNPVLLTTTTLADGSYSLEGLRPGTYSVTETQPIAFGDFDQSSDDPAADLATTNVISNLVLDPGETNTDNTFVEERATLSGHVFLDVNDDGIYTAGIDLPLAGEEVTLTGTDVLGNPVGPVTAITDADGLYVFTDLLAGTYQIDETAPVGWIDGTDTAGNLGGTALNDSITDIPVAGGADGVAYDFGERPPFGITGSITALNAEGGLDPVEGVTVLLEGTDLNGNPVSAIAVTDAFGDYRFDSLPPGTYTVTEVQPTGYGDLSTTAGPLGTPDDSVQNVISSIDIAFDPLVDEYSGNDFVEIYSSMSGTVFEDLNNDGVQDAGELGIAGVEVTLTGTDVNGDPVSVTVVTDADGNYSFVDLLSGEYTITEAQPAAFLDGTDTAGSSGGTAANPGDEIATITLAAGVDAAGYDFGELPAASVSGAVLDSNGAPIEGVEITLTGTDDLGNPVLLTTFTLADGSYSFEGLRPGTYSVTETQPAGFGEGGQVSDDPDAVTLVTNVISNVVLEPGEDSTGNDFVEIYSSMSGVVFHDLDDDGVQDAGELGIAGVEVTLTGTDVNGDPVSVTVVTDADGTYSFVDLLSGEYTITETQPPAYGDGTDTAGTVGGTATNPGDAISAIALPAGTDADSYAFAEVGAPIAGTVWIDDDRDGVIDAAEPGIAGVTITLLDADGNVVGTTMTDENGYYFFTDLLAGDYTIVQTQPTGYGSTTPSTLDVTLTPAGVTDADFGEDLGSIGDTVWADLDGDGVQDLGEPGVAGVTVKLFDEDGNVVATTTTDADGRYIFDRLLAGTYVLQIVVPADLALTAPGQGASDVDSDVDWLTAVTDPIVIGVTDCADSVPGRFVESASDCLMERPTDVDAGLVAPVIDLAISGSVPSGPVELGATVTFSYESRNNSNTPVIDGANVVIEFPPGLLPTTVDAPGWVVTINGQTVTLVLAETLMPGQQLPPFSVSARVLSSASALTVDARISTVNGLLETTFANNESVLGITVIERAIPTTGSTPAGMIRVATLLVLVGFVLLGGRRRFARD